MEIRHFTNVQTGVLQIPTFVLTMQQVQQMELAQSSFGGTVHPITLTLLIGTGL